jgi:hypothetical protein
VLYEDDPLFSVNSYTSASDVSIENVLRKYNARNGEDFREFYFKSF